MDFTDKVVLITGSSRGIGRASAIAFAERGAKVAVHYNRNSAAAEETRSMLPGGQHLILQADISDPMEVEAMVKKTADHFGRLDIVVNNAGIFNPHPIDEVSYPDWLASWRNTLETNLIGAANVCYCAAQIMIPQGGGRIINVSSRGAFRGEPEFPAYGASKAGMNAMSQSLAKKLGPHRIGVYAVAPGFVETDMTKPILESPEGDSIRNQSPMGRVARPEEVAYAILFYASEKAEFLTGGILDVNGASYLRS